MWRESRKGSIQKQEETSDLGCAKMVVESEYKQNTMKYMNKNTIITSETEHVKRGE